MKKLPKNYFDRLDDLKNFYQKQLIVLKAAIEDYNGILEEAYGKLKEAVGDYNEIITDVNAFKEEATSELENEFDGKSEKWQESDAGSEFRDWVDSWQNIDEFEGYELDVYETYEEPEEIEFNFEMEKP